VFEFLLLAWLFLPIPSAAAVLEDRVLERSWADLATHESNKAAQIMSALVARPNQTVSWLSKRLRPVTRADPKLVARLISDLDNNEFKKREKATKELLKLAEQVEPVLRKTLAAGSTPEVGRRVEQILEQLKGERLKPPAARVCSARAIAILEQIGTRRAQQLLTHLSQGAPEAALTVDAKGALERLVQRNPPRSRCPSRRHLGEDSHY
jgi:hypothetical protein